MTPPHLLLHIPWSWNPSRLGAFLQLSKLVESPRMLTVFRPINGSKFEVGDCWIKSVCLLQWSFRLLWNFDKYLCPSSSAMDKVFFSVSSRIYLNTYFTYRFRESKVELTDLLELGSFSLVRFSQKLHHYRKCFDIKTWKSRWHISFISWLYLFHCSCRLNIVTVSCRHFIFHFNYWHEKHGRVLL
jgi:hypothetical protein